MPVHPNRIYTKVSDDEIRAIRQICAEFGFRSTYQLMQSLIRALVRYADSVAYEEEDTSLGKEIEDMFNEMVEEQPRVKSYTTFKRNR